MASAAERLKLLYELGRELTTFTDLDEVLGYAIRRGREVFDAEGCAVLLLDHQRREFYFPRAAQLDPTSAHRLGTVRFPADRGIAGWVLQHNRAALVDDVSKDPRFYGGVDRQTHMTTRSLLCAPLRTRSGILGVIEVVNPSPEPPTADDLEFLEALAGDVAVAYEKTRLYTALRGEVVGLRQIFAWSGYALLAAGVLLIVGTVLGHLAWALPLSELPTRPGMISGIAAGVIGVVLAAVGRGWIVESAQSP